MIKYLAGIFDAEGYVRIRYTHNKFFTPEVKIEMTHEGIIKLFQEKYGGIIRVYSRGSNRKIIYSLSLGAKILKSSNFINDLLPYLNEKRMQLQEIKNLLFTDKPNIECYIDYMKYKKEFNHSINGILSHEYIAGIMDGDGWFTMFNSGKTNHSILNLFAVGLEQRYKPMIDYLLLFGGHVNIRKVLDPKKHNQTYEWKIGKRDMINLLIHIEPYLIEKKEICNLFIEYIKKCNELDELSIKTLNKIKNK